MAETYEDLKKKADEILRLAEEARAREAAEVVARIRTDVRNYKLTIEDIFPGALKSIRAEVKGVKYKGPNGETWVGGPGRKPKWIRDAIDSGEGIEKYRV
jgi:DNA-binding protein H-NS